MVMGKRESIKIAATSEELAAEYRAGATIRELARKYGCSFQNINIRLINAGVTMRPRYCARPPIPERTCPTCGGMFKPNDRQQRFCCAEHIRTKTVCKHGHSLTEADRYHYPSSNSRCKQCQRNRSKDYRDRKKAAKPA